MAHYFLAREESSINLADARPFVIKAVGLLSRSAHAEASTLRERLLRLGGEAMLLPPERTEGS